jgi:Zn finger protein HypA/HybF involved in hydrogenase expression
MTRGAPPPLPAEPAQPLHFTCPNCGASTAYAPGTTTLRCPSCGTEQSIDPSPRPIVEHSYDEWAALPPKPVATIGTVVLRCQGCGASTETDKLADVCQFCGGVLIALENPPGLIAPEAVVPFGVDARAANTAFREWVRSRRFAPNSLKKVGATENITGIYLPHWTFDAQTATDYTGQRGEHYWVTETYTVSDGRGGTRTETRQVQRTRWYSASGHVERFFNDVSVPASSVLPPDRLADAGPWALESAVAYRPQYLAGYSALRYDVDPDAGLATARAEMESVLEDDCRDDIGGDEQRVRQMDVRYSALMFKLVLLPLWIASYLHAGRTYQVVINANTGEVTGDRPISKLKVAAAVLAALMLVAAIITIWAASRRS